MAASPRFRDRDCHQKKYFFWRFRFCRDRGYHRGAMKRIRVLIVDEHWAARETLRSLLRTEEGMEIDALATLEALEKVGELGPDVVVVDRVVSKVNGGTIIHDFIDRSPGTRILMLAGFNEDERFFDAARPGALHILPKYAEPGELVRVIRELCNGDPALCAA